MARGDRRPIEAGADVSMGWHEPVLETTFERCMAAVTSGSTPATSTLRRSTRPHGRCAPARSDRRRGGYPEWLAIGEDMWVDQRWRELDMDMRFAPDAVVRWHLRSGLADTWRQYFRYARGDAQAGLHAERHALRFGVCAGLGAALASRRTWPRVLAAAGAVAVRPDAGAPRMGRGRDAPRARDRHGRRAGPDGVHRRREDGRLRGRPRGPARRSRPASRGSSG